MTWLLSWMALVCRSLGNGEKEEEEERLSLFSSFLIGGVNGGFRIGLLWWLVA